MISYDINNIFESIQKKGKALDELLDFCEHNNIINSILKKYSIDRIALSNIYKMLALNGASWVGEYFVPAASIVNSNTLLFIINNKEKKDWISLSFVLSQYFKIKDVINDEIFITLIKQQETDLVKLLINSGVNINAVDHDGTPAIFFAISNNLTEIVSLLINNGADINVTNEEGYTPLLLACSEENFEIVKLLILAGADVETRINDDGDTPLLIASQIGNIDIVRLLILAGADTEAADLIDNHTALYWAIAYNNIDVIKLLILAGANVNINIFNYPLVIESSTPLEWAIYNNYIDIVKLLISHGADVNMLNEDKENSLLFLFKKMYKKNEKENINKITKLLILAGVDVNIDTSMEPLPLYQAVENNCLEIARLLILAGTNIDDSIYSEENNILHIAVKNNYENMVNLLLKANITDVNIIDSDGNTALDIAETNENYTICKILKQYTEPKP